MQRLTHFASIQTGASRHPKHVRHPDVHGSLGNTALHTLHYRQKKRLGKISTVTSSIDHLVDFGMSAACPFSGNRGNTACPVLVSPAAIR